MILARDQILQAIAEGRLGIEPFELANVGACSVDLRLGNRFRRLRVVPAVAISERTRWEEVSDLIELKPDEELELRPGELVLGCTLERIRLGDDLCARIEGRTRFARLGLLVHVSSSLIQPGVDGVQVLELINMAPFAIRIRPGLRVCQLLFEELRGRARYVGEFRQQARP